MRRRPGIFPARVTASGHIVMPTDPGYHMARLKQPGDGAEPFAEDDPRLPELEQTATSALVSRWHRLGRDTLELLGLRPRKAPETFHFDGSLLPELQVFEAEFVADAAGPEAEYARSVFQAWLRGVANAAAELDADVLADEVRRGVRRELADRGLDLVRGGATRRFREAVVQQLADGAYDGENPADVARRLRRSFAAGEYNWERLARSEITLAQVRGKEAQYTEEGIEEYDYVTAGDGRVSGICRSNAAGSPYPVGAGPIPMRDSHPNCRCSIRPRIPEA